MEGERRAEGGRWEVTRQVSAVYMYCTGSRCSGSHASLQSGGVAEKGTALARATLGAGERSKI